MPIILSSGGHLRLRAKIHQHNSMKKPTCSVYACTALIETPGIQKSFIHMLWGSSVKYKLHKYIQWKKNQQCDPVGILLSALPMITNPNQRNKHLWLIKWKARIFPQLFMITVRIYIHISQWQRKLIKIITPIEGIFPPFLLKTRVYVEISRDCSS